MSPDRSLADRLLEVRASRARWQPLYDSFVARLNEIGVGRSAPKAGDAFPAFGLPNSRGRYVRLDELLDRRALVLSFNRGSWCPYCKSELDAWHDALPDLSHLNARFVSVMGEVGGRPEKVRLDIGDDAEMLCDLDHGMALRLGLAFQVSAEVRQAYLDVGLDLAKVYGTQSWFLPVPATFVIDSAGIVRFSFADPDFRLRAEPEAVLQAVRSIAG